MSTEQTYKIKPLVWEYLQREFMERYEATVPMGTYRVERHREGYDETKPWEDWKMEYCFAEYYDEASIEVETPEKGMEMAAQDWLTRILPALEPQP